MSRNEGARLLDRTGATEEEIGAACAVSSVAAHYWKRGDKKPTKNKRAILFAKYGIPEPAWDQIAKSSAGVETVDFDDDAHEDDGEGANVDAMIAELKRMAKKFLADLRDDADMAPLARARVMSSLASTLNVLAKMSGDYDLGRRVLQTPVWKRLEARILKALEGHPEAMAAVVDAISDAATEVET